MRYKAVSFTSLPKSPATLKRCTKCSIEKHIAEFGRAYSRKDGLNPWCKACKAAYYQANYERINAKQAAWKQAHREKLIAYYAAYRAVRKKEIAARQAVYWKANPEKARANNHRRRAKKRSAPGAHTAQQVQNLLQKQCFRCAYCKSSIKKKYHIDHIIALANSGSNDISNIQLLCPACNCKKQDKDPIIFAQKIGLLL